MPLYTPLSGAVPSGASSTAATAGSSGLAARGDHQHPSTIVTPGDHGIIGWNYPADLAGSSTIMPTATLVHIAKILVPTAQTITNLHIHIATQGGTLTNSYMALYNSAKGLLSQSADQSSANSNWQTGGFKAVALGTPQVVAAGVYYVAFWVGTAVTMPTPSRSSNNSIVNANLATAVSRWATADTAITTTGPSTLGTFTATNIAYWVGWS